MKNISVIVVVYNEEERIDNFCKSFQWSNDLIIVNKSSTDSTKEKAKKYNCTIIDVPYSDIGSEHEEGLKIAKNEWIMIVTASDSLTLDLADEVLRLINLENFDYDVILMPYAFYALGLKEDYSPWNPKYTNKLAKRKAIRTSGIVHEEYKVETQRVYKIPNKEKWMFYHMTHRNLDVCFERHLRYAKAEVKRYANDKDALKKIKIELLKTIIKGVVKGTFFKGDKGLGLGLLYLDYVIQKYLYVWEDQKKINGELKYQEIYEENFIRR